MKLVDFEYDGIKASDFGLRPCYFESDDTEITPVEDIDMHLVKAAHADSFYSCYAGYNDAITFTLGIVTNPCEADFDEAPLPQEKITDLYRWLTRKRFKKFKPIFDDESFQNVFANVTFNITPHTAMGQVIGFSLQGITDAPFAYYEEQRVQSNPDENFLIFIDNSDMEGHIYLDAEITIKSAGDFELINEQEPKKKTVIKNCEAGEVITFDGKRKQISSNKAHPKLMNDFNWFFPRAVNRWNERVNIFTANLPFQMNVRYFPICKGGLLT